MLAFGLLTTYIARTRLPNTSGMDVWYVQRTYTISDQSVYVAIFYSKSQCNCGTDIALPDPQRSIDRSGFSSFFCLLLLLLLLSFFVVVV